MGSIPGTLQVHNIIRISGLTNQQIKLHHSHIKGKNFKAYISETKAH
jgi:hypothetical protein